MRWAVLLLVVNGLAAPFAGFALAKSPAVVAVAGTAVALAAAITAYALLGRYARQREAAALPAAAAYLCLAAFAAANLLTFPDVFVEPTLFGATSQTAAWCRYIGLGLFGLGIAWYALAARRSLPPVPIARARAGVWAVVLAAPLLAAAFVALSVRAPGLLPTIVDQDHLLPALTSGVSPATAFLVATGLWLLLRGRLSALGAWLALALFAALLEVVVSHIGGVRFSLGWYVARFDDVLAATVVLVFFVGDVNARLARSDAARSTQADMLYAGLDVRTVMDRVTKRILALTPAEGSVVEVVEGPFIEYRAGAGLLAASVGERVPLAGTFSGLCVRTNKALYCEDTHVDPRVNSGINERLGVRSKITAPLTFGHEVIGVITAAASKPNAFGGGDMEVLSAMADAVAAALVNASSYGQAVVESRIDGLTGLGNRRAYEQRLDVEAAEAARSGQPLSVAVLDLNGFKDVNDRFGHPAGDQCLRDVADAMRSVVRGRDECFRIGGDEFAVVMPDTPATDAGIAIDRLSAAIASCRSTTGAVTASIGLAQADDGDPAALHERADRAMYEAKRRSAAAR